MFWARQIGILWALKTRKPKFTYLYRTVTVSDNPLNVCSRLQLSHILGIYNQVSGFRQHLQCVIKDSSYFEELLKTCHQTDHDQQQNMHSNLIHTTSTASLGRSSLTLPFRSVSAANVRQPMHFRPKLTESMNFLSEIAETAGPAVVFVEIKEQRSKDNAPVTVANGSGFIVRENGLVLTNLHVVENRTKVTVKLYDGTRCDGLVTVIDPVSDLAIIKIDAPKKLPTLPLGKCSSIRPGEFVVAMGSPLSLHRSITWGIVSGPLRDNKELGLKRKMDFIQTDAVIGLGNSGGPLVNLDGEAIGINCIRLTDGISFAIPADYANYIINYADKVAKEESAKQGADHSLYLHKGETSSEKRRYMGITMVSLTPQILRELREQRELRDQRDFPEIRCGVYVHKVMVSSPAYTGGLHPRDIIISINDTPMENTADVYSMVEDNDTLRLEVIRGTHTRNFTVETEKISTDWRTDEQL